MTHPENQSQATRFIIQARDIHRECFHMAEGIVREAVERNKFDGKTREEYFASVPSLAESLAAGMVNVAQVVKNANSTQMDQMYDGMQVVLEDLRKVNKVNP